MEWEAVIVTAARSSVDIVIALCRAEASLELRRVVKMSSWDPFAMVAFVSKHGRSKKGWHRACLNDGDSPSHLIRRRTGRKQPVKPLVVHDGLGSVEIKTFDQDTRKGCCWAQPAHNCKLHFEWFQRERAPRAGACQPIAIFTVSLTTHNKKKMGEFL